MRTTLTELKQDFPGMVDDMVAAVETRTATEEEIHDFAMALWLLTNVGLSLKERAYLERAMKGPAT